jgi:hypothetical protein
MIPCLQEHCKIPSPFIMSHDWHAYVLHQKEFFRNKLFTKTQVSQQTNKHQHQQNKITHANKLYQDWHTRKCKRIRSNRLGLQYIVKYQANGSKNVLKGNRCMYRKKYMNFQFTPSKNPCMRQKQKVHFT